MNKWDEWQQYHKGQEGRKDNDSVNGNEHIS